MSSFNLFPKELCKWAGHAVMIVVVLVLVMIVVAEELFATDSMVNSMAAPFIGKGIWVVLVGFVLARGLAHLDHTAEW